MDVPELPGALDAAATYKGVGSVLEHPEREAGPENPPTAAYHWWKVLSADNTEFYVVAAARLEDIRNSAQDGPGSPMESMRYWIDSFIRTGATATSSTPVYEFNPADQSMLLWTPDDAGRLALDMAIRARAEFAASGKIGMTPEQLIAVRDAAVSEWPDADERATMANLIGHPELMEDAGPGVQELAARLQADISERLGAVTVAARNEMVLHGGDAIKKARSAVVVTRPVALGEITRHLKPTTVHAPEQRNGQYL